MKPKRKTKKSIQAPVVRYDPALDKYEGVVLFPEKLAQANEDIKNTNLVELIKEFEEKKKQNTKTEK